MMNFLRGNKPPPPKAPDHSNQKAQSNPAHFASKTDSTSKVQHSVEASNRSVSNQELLSLQKKISFLE